MGEIAQEKADISHKRPLLVWAGFTLNGNGDRPFRDCPQESPWGQEVRVCPLYPSEQRWPERALPCAIR